MTLLFCERLSVSQSGSLWLFGFNAFGESADEWAAASLLSEQDLQRWRRFRPVAKKQQFLNSRVAIQQVLQAEFSNSSAIRCATLSDGRPVLVDGSQVEVASISLSHSENIVAVALDHQRLAVGVDCEVVNNVSPRNVCEFLGCAVSDLFHWSAGAGSIEAQDGVEFPLGGVPVTSGSSDGKECGLADVNSMDLKWLAAGAWTEYEATWKALPAALKERFSIQSWLDQRLAAKASNESCSDFPLTKLFLSLNDMNGVINSTAALRKSNMPSVCVCLAGPQISME